MRMQIPQEALLRWVTRCLRSQQKRQEHRGRPANPSRVGGGQTMSLISAQEPGTSESREDTKPLRRYAQSETWRQPFKRQASGSLIRLAKLSEELRMRRARLSDGSFWANTSPWWRPWFHQKDNSNSGLTQVPGGGPAFIRRTTPITKPEFIPAGSLEVRNVQASPL